MPRLLPVALSFALLMFTTHAFAQAPTTLTVASTPGVITGGQGLGEGDAGTVDSASHGKAGLEFTVVNNNTHAVTIGRLRGTCGCEILTLQKDGANLPSATLAPGAQAQIVFQVDLTHQPIGKMEKVAWLDPSPVGPPLAMLTLDMTIRPTATWSPEQVSLGQVSLGQPAMAYVTVSVDAASMPKSGLPRLVSSASQFTVVPISIPQPTSRDGKPGFSQQYQINFAPQSQPGRLISQLSFQLPDKNASFLKSIVIPAEVDVAGRLSASPSTIFFGSISTKALAQREVVVNCSTKSLLTAKTSVTWLTCAVGPAIVSAGGSAQWSLTVAVDKTAPTGPFSQSITVTTAAGDSVAIPITGTLIL